MILLMEILSEYTEQEKQKMGIPSDAVSRGGKWYQGDTYIGKTVNGKFVRVRTAGGDNTPKQTNSPKEAPPEQKKQTPVAPVISAPTKPNPSFDELRQEARKHRYTVMTRAPLSQITSANAVNPDTNSIGKPGGFWFGVGSEWVDWTESDMPEWKGDNLYSVEVDESQCLVIQDEFDFKDFSRTYGTRGGMIDWGRVSKDHKGVIIRGYFPKYRMNPQYRWYYSWDIASGCVWDASAIKQVEQQSIT